MPRDTIAVGADHAGFALKATLAADLGERGYAVTDCGAFSEAAVDYPDVAYAVGREVAAGRATLGVLVCGSGIGMAIAANRDPAIRAALCTEGLMARMAREHNDANVLVLGSRISGVETARDCLDQFLGATFTGGRHAGRVAKLSHPEIEVAR